MEYKTKRSGSYNVELQLDFNAAEIEAAYKEAYTKARKSMKLDGFRKGKVPLDIVEKTLGDYVIEDVGNILLQTGLKDILEDLEPAPVNMPNFSIEKLERHKKAVIKGEYETLPQFKLGKYKKLKATQDIPVVPDSLIDEELEKLRAEKAIMVTRETDEPACLEDKLKADLTLLDADAKEIYKQNEIDIELIADNMLPGMAEAITGIKSGEEKSFTLDIPEDYKDQELAGTKVTVEIKIHTIQYAEKPALDDEFAKDAGEYETISDLKESIRAEKLQVAQDQIKRQVQDELLDQLREASKIEVPATLIEKEASYRLDNMARRLGIQFPSNRARNSKSRKRNKARHSNDRNELSLDQKLDYLAELLNTERSTIESDLKEAASKGVAEQLVLREVVQKEALEASDSEIDSRLKELYGEHFKDLKLDKLIQNPESRSRIADQIKDEKAIDLLFNLADIKKGAEVAVDKIGQQQLD